MDSVPSMTLVSTRTVWLPPPPGAQVYQMILVVKPAAVCPEPPALSAGRDLPTAPDPLPLLPLPLPAEPPPPPPTCPLQAEPLPPPLPMLPPFARAAAALAAHTAALATRLLTREGGQGGAGGIGAGEAELLPDQPPSAVTECPPMLRA